MMAFGGRAMGSFGAEGSCSPPRAASRTDDEEGEEDGKVFVFFGLSFLVGIDGVFCPSLKLGFYGGE